MLMIKKPRRMAREPEENVGGLNPDNGEIAITDQPQPHEPRVSKKSTLIAMLGNHGGTSLVAMITATGWLPHTMRAALTGLRKQGHNVERFKVDGETHYRIVPGAAGE